MRIEEEKDCSIQSSEVLLYRYVVKKKKKRNLGGCRCCYVVSLDEREYSFGCSLRNWEVEYRHVKRRNSVVSCCYASKEVVHSFWDDARCLVYDEVVRVHFSYAVEVDHDLVYDEVEPELVHSSYV